MLTRGGAQIQDGVSGAEILVTRLDGVLQRVRPVDVLLLGRQRQCCPRAGVAHGKRLARRKRGGGERRLVVGVMLVVVLSPSLLVPVCRVC